MIALFIAASFFLFKDYTFGNSLVVQWLGLGSFTARAQVQTLVGKLKSRKPCGAAKKKKDYTF